MIWMLAAVAAVASAFIHQRWVVPRLRTPLLADDETAPDYRPLASWPNVLGAAALALLGSALVLPGSPTAQLLLWLGYLGAGAALVWVDLRTTWLPRQLNHLCLTQVGVGLLALGITDWRRAVAALAGGVAAFAVFHLVWRLGTGFGYGDVRLAAIVGAVAGSGGLQHWFASILAGTVTGAVWAILHSMLRRRTNAPAHFPYGPSLWLGPVLAGWISGW